VLSLLIDLNHDLASALAKKVATQNRGQAETSDLKGSGSRYSKLTFSDVAQQKLADVTIRLQFWYLLSVLLQ